MRASVKAACTARNPLIPLASAALRAILSAMATSPVQDSSTSYDSDTSDESSDESLNSEEEDETSEPEVTHGCSQDCRY